MRDAAFGAFSTRVTASIHQAVGRGSPRRSLEPTPAWRGKPRPTRPARFVPRQIVPRLPPGRATGAAFFGAKVHWTFADPSSPPGRRVAARSRPARRGRAFDGEIVHRTISDPVSPQAATPRFPNRTGQTDNPLPSGLRLRPIGPGKAPLEPSLPVLGALTPSPGLDRGASGATCPP